MTFKALGRNTIEITLAKPLSDKKKQAQSKRDNRNSSFDAPFNNVRNEFDNGSTSGASSFNNDQSRGGGRPNDSFSLYSIKNELMLSEYIDV